MIPPDSRWRLVLAAVLALYGALLRWGPARGEAHLALPWAKADPEVAFRTNRRLGLWLWLWAAWLALSVAVSFRGSPWGMLAAPLVLVVLLTVSYSARLYVHKYETYRVERIRSGEDRPIPAKGGWWVVAARELLPMAAFLVPILVLHSQLGDLPARIPVRLSLLEGPTDWRLKYEALNFLRQQTRFAYLALLLGEAAYLVWKWAGKTHRSLAPRLLSRGHWKYFFFRTGWVALFAGVNLGCVAFAQSDRALAPYLIPGFCVLAGVGVLNWWDQRQTTYAPPSKSTAR